MSSMSGHRVRKIPFEEQPISFYLCKTKVFMSLRRLKSQFKMLLEIYVVLPDLVQNKNVSTSIKGKRIVTNVCNAQHAATLWMFLLKTKN